MKILAASILICLSLSALAAYTAAPRESCSCTAADGSCSAGVTCSGGCLAFCPSNNCRAMCSSGGRGSVEYADLLMRVTLRLQGSNSRAVSAELARVTGRNVVFTPATPGDTFSLDVKDAQLWSVLEILSASGKIQIAGEDFSNLQALRRALLQGERMPVCVSGTTVKRLVEELEQLTGLEIRVTSGDPKTVVNLTAGAVNLDELVAQVSERAGVRITIR